MNKRKHIIISFLGLAILVATRANAQINTETMMRVGQNAMYFDDYVLSIRYFNTVIAAKPYLAQPYFLRAVAKINLEDYGGAEQDATMAIERNPFLTDAYEVRGVSRHNLGHVRQAIEDYDRVLATLPYERGILLNRAMAYQELDDTAGARSSFDALIAAHPKFDAAYVGRGRLKAVMGDTVGANADIDHAIELNSSSVNAYLVRADLAASSDSFVSALQAMDMACKLQPHTAGFYINRAFIKYQLDDYMGAMSDYDYAIELDPTDPMAYYNRALLRSEVHDYDRAVADLDRVLALRGLDYRALFNRAAVQRERRQYDKALEDINSVIDEFPNLAAAYFLRADIKQSMGDKTAQKDYDHSLTLAQTTLSQNDDATSEQRSAEARVLLTVDPESQDAVAAKFTSLLTVNESPNVEHEYSSKGIRGRVQDFSNQAEIEPIFVASYYSSPTQLKPSSEFLRDVDDVNSTRALRQILQVTNREPSIQDDEQINRHFASIDYYTSYLSTHSPRAVDYFGRGMDYFTLRNYRAAVEDFTRALELTPDFALARFMRGVSRYRENQSSKGDASTTEPRMLRLRNEEIMADFDAAIAASPDMALAIYNKGVVLLDMEAWSDAIACFDKAVEINPRLGEAFYNRGFAYLKTGHRTEGISDLSHAGELGIVASYMLLKRMSR